MNALSIMRTSASRLVADLSCIHRRVVASRSERRLPAHQVEAVGRRFTPHHDFALVAAAGLRHVLIQTGSDTPFGVRCCGTGAHIEQVFANLPMFLYALRREVLRNGGAKKRLEQDVLYVSIRPSA